MERCVGIEGRRGGRGVCVCVCVGGLGSGSQHGHTRLVLGRGRDRQHGTRLDLPGGTFRASVTRIAQTHTHTHTHNRHV